MTDVYRLKTPLDLKVALARILRSALLADLSDIDRSLICTLASELGSNVIKYARYGDLCISRKDTSISSEIEVKASDRGPGISDIELALSESFSSGGTLGLGLPGVKRLADDLTINSVPGSGTTVIARKRIRRSLAPTATLRRMPSASRESRPVHASSELRQVIPDSPLLDIGFKVRAYAGLSVSGDQTVSVSMPEGCLLGVIDVTGHGPQAADLAKQMVTFIHTHATSDLEYLMTSLNTSFANTLGAAVGLAFVRYDTHQVMYLGVGNTALLLVSEKNWRPISKDGVVGLRMPSPLLQSAPFRRNDILIMYSDGVSDAGLVTELKKYAFRSAAVIAGSLVALAGKLYDDATCLVVKWKD